MNEPQQKRMRYRDKFIIFSTLIVLIAYTVVDPDLGLIQNLRVGSGTILTVLAIAAGVIQVSLLYYVRKAMHDYPAADLESLGTISRRSAEGAGMYTIGLGLHTLSYAIIFAAAVIANSN